MIITREPGATREGDSVCRANAEPGRFVIVDAMHPQETVAKFVADAI